MVGNHCKEGCEAHTQSQHVTPTTGTDDAVRTTDGSDSPVQGGRRQHATEAKVQEQRSDSSLNDAPRVHDARERHHRGRWLVVKHGFRLEQPKKQRGAALGDGC